MSVQSRVKAALDPINPFKRADRRARGLSSSPSGAGAAPSPSDAPIPAVGVGSARGRPPSVGFGERESLSNGVAASPFVESLNDIRWMAQREAQVVASQDLDHTLWPDQHLSFDFERAIAHQHEDIRQRLATWVRHRQSEAASDLAVSSEGIVLALDDLKEADRDAITALKQWERAYDDIQADEAELARFHRLRSRKTQIRNTLLFCSFAGAEGAITFIIFNDIVDHWWQAALLSIGAVLVTTFIPHQAAILLREGLTQRHLFEEKQLRDIDVKPSYNVLRKVHLELVEDRGAKIMGSMLALLLVLLVLPLASLRATHLKDSYVEKATQQQQRDQSKLAFDRPQVKSAQKELNSLSPASRLRPSAEATVATAQATVDQELLALKRDQKAVDRANRSQQWQWFIFFAVLQWLISLYFFAREWVDHGVASVELLDFEKTKRCALATRIERREALTAAVRRFHQDAERLLNLARNAPHWDQQIVENFYTTMWYFRHVVADAHQDLAWYVHNARIPSLAVLGVPIADAAGTSLRSDEPDAPDPASNPQPTATDNPSLQEDVQLYGQRNWINRGVGALGTAGDAATSEQTSGRGEDTERWILSMDPLAYLRYFLGRFDHGPIYTRPPELDDTEFVVHDDHLEALAQMDLSNTIERLREEAKAQRPKPDAPLNGSASASGNGHHGSGSSSTASEPADATTPPAADE